MGNQNDIQQTFDSSKYDEFNIKLFFNFLLRNKLIIGTFSLVNGFEAYNFEKKQSFSLPSIS